MQGGVNIECLQLEDSLLSQTVSLCQCFPNGESGLTGGSGPGCPWAVKGETDKED